VLECLVGHGSGAVEHAAPPTKRQRRSSRAWAAIRTFSRAVSAENVTELEGARCPSVPRAPGAGG
jgi:hypothetical protein